MKRYLLIISIILSLLNNTSLVSQIPTNGLVAYYPFNGNAIDESGNGNNGINNGASLTYDRFGISSKAYSFNGTSNSIVVPSSASLNSINDEITVSCWIKKNSTASSELIVSRRDPTTQGVHFQLMVKPADVSFQYSGIGAPSPYYELTKTRNNPSSLIIDNRWHFITFTHKYGGRSKSKIYIDNVEYKTDSTGWYADNFPYPAAITNSELRFGNQNISPSYLFYNGNIDDIRIYNRALVASEIETLYLENGWGPVPAIASFTPNSGPVGTTVLITGLGFSTTLSNNIVWFGAVKAAITAATATSLTVTVPVGATYQPITVTVNGLTAYSSKPFNVTFASIETIDGSSLRQKVDISSGNGPENVVIADIDVDGKPDLIVGSVISNIVSVYRNISKSGSISAGSLDFKVDLTVPGMASGIAVSDIDCDGKPDIIVTAYTNNTVSVFRNNNSSGSITAGSFNARVDFASGKGPYSVTTGEINGDGKPEIVVSNFMDNSVSVFRNTSTPGTITTGSLGAKIDYSSGTGPIGNAVRDIDGDSKHDLIIVNSDGNSFSILRNNSTSDTITTSSFLARMDFTTGTNPYQIAIGDIDGDGKSDIAITNTGGSSVSIFRNKSSSGSLTNSSFETRVDIPSGSNPRGITYSDIDGDNRPDIVVANQFVSTVSVFRNLYSSGSIGLSSFSPKVDFATGDNPYGIAVGDIDGDGKPDIVSANKSINTVSILKNAILLSAPVVGAITQPTCPAPTGNVLLSGLPPTGTWTLTRSPGGSTTNGNGSATTISGIAPGTYTYIVTDSNGNTSASSSNIVINMPSGTPSTPIQGTIVQPTCITPTGSIDIGGLPSSGNWTLTITPGSSSTGTGEHAPVAGLSPGTYSFTVTNTAGCTSAPLENIVINAVSVGNIPVIELKWNSVLICFNMNNVFTSWQWYKDNNPVGSVTDKAWFNTNKSGGMYKVYTTDKDGCKNYSNTIQVNSGSKGISAYPNPADGNITISITDDSRGKAVISIYNESGIKVIELQTDKSNDNLLREIPVNGIDQGIYLVKITIDRKEVNFTRIVVAR